MKTYSAKATHLPSDVAKEFDSLLAQRQIKSATELLRQETSEVVLEQQMSTMHGAPTGSGQLLAAASFESGQSSLPPGGSNPTYVPSTIVLPW